MNAITSENQNRPHIGDKDIATELSKLFTCDQPERRNRINALGLTKFIGALRLLRQIDDELIEYSDQWHEAYTWGRGMPYPDESKTGPARPAEAEAEPFAVAVERAATALAALV